MMTNLFSIFDPSTFILSFPWMIIIMMIVMIPCAMWKMSSSKMKMMKMMMNTLKKEINFSMKKTEKMTTQMILSIFMIIMMMNILGLYPQTFSPTAHLSVTMPMSLIMWVTVMLFGWTKNTKNMLIHLVPQGTPHMLLMFMVMIELTSNLIRPITLCVRLTANILAGHLLMSLIGKSLLSIPMWAIIPSAIIPLMLTTLEVSVSIIQAYVFMTLMTLYTAETK